MIGLTNLRSSGPLPMAPKLNRRRALFVLEKIDEILHWERQTERERDTRFVELGRYLCEVRAGQYWRVDNLKSFDEFLEKKFPESRRKAYYLMAIHEQLPRQTHRDLRQVGWTKAAGASQSGAGGTDRTSIVQPGCTKRRRLPREEFKREVERHLTGKETEPWEMLYFKVYKSQLAVIEQALETASLMLGGQNDAWLLSRDDLCGFSGWRKSGRLRQPGLAALGTQSDLPAAAEFSAPGVLAADSESVMNPPVPRQPRLRLDRNFYRELRQRVLERDSWRCQRCGISKDLQVHHRQPRSHLGGDAEENLITVCSVCHREIHLRAENPARFERGEE